MNSYELTEKMRKLRREFQFTSIEQALYYELIAICNNEKWKIVFNCSCNELCNALKTTKKTLINSRESLLKAGLIYYEQHKGQGGVGRYSLTKPFKKRNEDDLFGEEEQKTPPKIIPETPPESIPKVTPSTTHNNVPVEKTKTETKTKEEILKEEKFKEEYPFADVRYMKELLTWLEYKKHRRETYKTRQSLEACYRKLVKLSNNSPDEAGKMIEESMANNWSGFFALKEKQKAKHNFLNYDNTREHRVF